MSETTISSTLNFKLLQQKVAKGDKLAFRQIFDSLFTPLTKFAYSFVHSRETATEIIDEIFVQLWIKRVDIVEIKDVKVYLYTATKNASLNYLVKKAKQVELEPYDHLQVQLADSMASPEQIMISKELMDRIKLAVDALPPRCKLIFKLVREDGLKYAEVASILSLSIKTIDNQMVIAVSKIKEAVQDAINMPKSPIYIKK